MDAPDPLTLYDDRFTLFTMSDQQREKILTCACDLYLQDGLDGFSMRKLARAVGVTAPALYRHYESKERVLVDVVGEAYRQLAQTLYRALEGRTPVERFRLAGAAYLDFALENPRLYAVLFGPAELLGMEEGNEELEAQACAIGQFWNDRVRECIDAGILREGDPEGIGLTLWAHFHGLLTLYLRGMLQVDEATFRTMARGSGSRMFRGLGTEAFAAMLEAEIEDTAPAGA